ncbi:MFS transporter [Pseudooceanicola nanhaiensis]|uniref:MFS transporter n=1 Tax=Pseudooceanicola nanhaiensis TaxID=375761 RepID=UPI001CD7DE7E|nr:MFS transporter [Pseudooceanicola nanhaiensis]MCA0922945.1 MFS transporter [Pseudooceanicola nanhaiensis]
MPGDRAESAGPAFQRLVWLMAVTAGLVVANNYYNQPLLAEIAEDFSTSERAAALIATLTQVGYAAGLLLLLPLGDMIERRRIISVLLVASSGMLVAFALMPALHPLMLVGFLVGFSSVVPQFLPPIASKLAPKGQAGRAVGLVMGGLLLGIILSRFVGGVVGGTIGWRTLYLVAAGLMLVLLVLLRRALPVMEPTFTGSYRGLLSSLGVLFLRHSRLRVLACVAALQFGAFSLFWTTIIFHVERSIEGEATVVVGLLALIGAVGVLAAPMAGRLSERLSSDTILAVSGALMVAAFVLMGLGGGPLYWVIPAVVLLDLGMQVSHVTSMSEVLQLEPQAGNRMNTIYMVIRFAGAAMGTFAGSQAWHFFGWTGVTLLGVGITAAALVVARSNRFALTAATPHDGGSSRET